MEDIIDDKGNSLVEQPAEIGQEWFINDKYVEPVEEVVEEPIEQPVEEPIETVTVSFKNK